jgi:hypothetical protein
MTNEFESKFSDGTDITNYQAVGYAERSIINPVQVT